MCVVSLKAGRKRWRDNSSNPKRDSRPQLDARTIHFDRVAQHVFHGALIGRGFHVDEIDDDQAADVAQPQLPGDFLGGFQIGIARGGFDVAAASTAGRIDVDRDQRLGVIDHQTAAGGQSDLVRIRRFDLALDLIAREQRHRIRDRASICAARPEA